MVHLLTLGAYAWEDTNAASTKKHDDRGGDIGSVFNGILEGYWKDIWKDIEGYWMDIGRILWRYWPNIVRILEGYVERYRGDISFP